MREIKFRAWERCEKEMSEWTDLITAIDLGYLLDDPEDFEIMQYTGLKDNSGVEIYEGDIVRYKTELKSPFDGRTKLKVDSIHTVVFLEGAFMTQHINGNSGFHELRYKADSSDGSNLEIIGNIYENPELLEGNQ